MKRLHVAEFLTVLAVLAFVLWPRHEPVPIAPTIKAAPVNPICRIARNVTDTYPPEPNREDTRKAQLTWGGDPSFLGDSDYARKQYARAFALLQKIDGEGTDALAALPSGTPNIDLVIDRHVMNLATARIMLAVFYEQGRLARPDPAQAAAFYEKAFGTTYIDDRGCAHASRIDAATRKRYVAVLVYDLRTPEAHAKAMAVLQEGGPQFASALYLLGKNMLPSPKYEFFETNLDAMAEEVRNPSPQPNLDWLTNAEINDSALFGLLGRILLWCAVAVTLFAGGLGLFRYIRRKQGYKDEASIYHTLFRVYDMVHGVVARFGLVAEGVVGCFVGLSILAGGYAYELGQGTNFIVIVTGVSSFLGGLSKIVEAARMSASGKNTLVHGSARPAGEGEAQAAARGAVKAPDLGNRTFRE